MPEMNYINAYYNKFLHFPFKEYCHKSSPLIQNCKVLFFPLAVILRKQSSNKLSPRYLIVFVIIVVVIVLFFV